MAATRKAITSSKVAEIQRLAALGHTREEIAKAVGVSIETVSRRRRNDNDVGDEEVALFKRLRAIGYTRRQIAEKTGRSTRTLDRYLAAEDPEVVRQKRAAAMKDLNSTVTFAPKDREHLQAVIAEGGFGWWPDKALERLYALERPLPQGRPFWRAA